jgi:hypothetical protein
MHCNSGPVQSDLDFEHGMPSRKKPFKQNDRFFVVWSSSSMKSSKQRDPSDRFLEDPSVNRRFFFF